MADIVFLHDFALIYFSVKNAFSGLFFHKQKGARVFRWQEDINVLVIIALSSTKPHLIFFENSSFSQHVWGNVNYVPETNLISLFPLIKVFYLPKKNNLKEIWDTERRKTAEDDDTKINVSLNIPFTFLALKASAFIQIFFLRKSKFLRTSIFFNGKCLTLLYLLTYLFL